MQKCSAHLSHSIILLSGSLKSLLHFPQVQGRRSLDPGPQSYYGILTIKQPAVAERVSGVVAEQKVLPLLAKFDFCDLCSPLRSRSAAHRSTLRSALSLYHYHTEPTVSTVIPVRPVPRSLRWPDRTKFLLKSKKPVRSIRSARSRSRSACGLYGHLIV